MADAKGKVEPAGIRLTSPDKVLFPDQGVTKRDLAQYLLETAEFMLPYLAKRPLSFVRCPDGHHTECFFQKHDMPGFPESFGRVELREKSGEKATYLCIEDAAALVASAQMGVLELHLWGARIDKLEKPDRLVFDLDPAPDVGFDEVRKAARQVRDLLASAGLESFALLTGGKGIHVIAPLARRHSWDDVKRFAAGLARELSKAAPDRFTDKASKAGRKGRIFIDWLRNQRGSTAIAPYSARAREGAPVATPVSWNELSKVESASKYALGKIGPRLKALKTDPWSGYFELRQSISKKTLAAVDGR